MQVFFESEQSPNIAFFNDAIVQIGQTTLSPLRQFLILHGLAPGFLRYRRNWLNLRKVWQSMLQEAYERPMPQDCTAFWACLCRSFPEAMTDQRQYEYAIANLAVMYGAGSETTVNAIVMTLGALALDASSLQRLEQVRDLCAGYAVLYCSPVGFDHKRNACKFGTPNGTVLQIVLAPQVLMRADTMPKPHRPAAHHVGCISLCHGL
jgi:cytochrome P450